MKKEPEQATREELLRENARLRGDLLTIAHRISHDLRTPLGGIITTGEILKEILAENSSSPASLMTPLFDSVDDLAKLIENVSFVLKASANPPAKEIVKMEEIVFRTLQRLEARILKKKATISEPATWPEVNGVFTWLEVVWGNLLANALRHGKGRIELGWREEKGAFRFWVADNGGGVAPEKHEALFHPFHALHKPNAAGGLGLSIVQRLMELQGGTCGYEHLPDGARFFFTLPAAKNSEAPGASPALPKIKSATKMSV
jgi:K+-sensing histidine kinase KdpD